MFIVCTYYNIFKIFTYYTQTKNVWLNGVLRTNDVVCHKIISITLKIDSKK